MTENTLNVHQRLAAAMGEVDYIQKEAKRGMQYTIVSHDAVTAKVRPVLLRNGIVYYPVRCDHHQDGNRAECSMTLRFVNIDQPTDFFEVPTFGYGIDPQDKGPGKAMSYAVKYALLKALGLETGDDPDHDSIPYVPPSMAAPEPAVKSSAQLKKDGEWERVSSEIANSMQDVVTFGQFEKLKASYRTEAGLKGWNMAFKAALKDLFIGYEADLQKRVDDENSMLGGTGMRDPTGRELSLAEAG